MTNSHAPGTWYLAPSDDLTNEYSAGYDGNSFATREEAEAAIEGLGEAFGDDAEWVAVQRRPDVAAYLAEIVAVGKRYGFSLSHEDHQGGFLVEERNDRSERWLLGAKATPSLLVTGLQRVKGLRSAVENRVDRETIVAFHAKAIADGKPVQASLCAEALAGDAAAWDRCSMMIRVAQMRKDGGGK